ncbi:MAG: cell division protein FtsZ [Bacteroidetes bacterium]|nr:cell division protein FtsZ [Bacteroidota bacterium]
MSIDINSNAAKIYDNENNAKICIIGVGGAGGNAVNNMITRGINGVTFMAANTDKQALDKVKVDKEHQFLLGKNQKRIGLGAGSNPEVGKIAAEESAEELKAALTGFDMIFITCGMGGGTGTGASPVIAKIAKETDTLVIGIVAKCFSYEGKKKNERAMKGIEELKAIVDSFVIVPNDKILEVYRDIKITEAYHKANDVLYNAISGIVDIITDDCDENIDFADVRTALAGAGEVIISVGTGKGENAGRDALIDALSSPFFDELSVKGAEFVLLKAKYGNDFTVQDICQIFDTLEEKTGDSVDLKCGKKAVDDSDEIVVTILSPVQKVEKKDSVNQNNNYNKNSYNDDKVNASVNNTQKVFSSDFSAFANNSYENQSTSDIEIIKDQGIGNKFDRPLGRPHGEAELKKYDEPAYKRIKISMDANNKNNSIPDNEDRYKIQRILESDNQFEAKTTRNSLLNQMANQYRN